MRDAALKMQDNIPKSDVNREYYQQNNEAALAKTGGSSELRALSSAESSIGRTCVITFL